METNELLAKGIRSNFEMLKGHIADFSDADMLVRPTPSANHANWQLGHLVGFQVMACSLVGVAGPALPADFKTRYNKDTAASDDPATFLTKGELLALMTESNAALATWAASLSPEAMGKPTPPPFDKFVPTLAELAIAIPVHATMHLGQIQVIRRALGRARTF